MFPVEFRNGKIVRKRLHIEDIFLDEVIKKLNRENYSQKELNAMHPARRIEILRARSRDGAKKAKQKRKSKK